MNDGGRWIFETSGEPYDFEQIERYAAKRKRDRFTHEMLAEYLAHFGISAFDESFYLSPSECVAYLVYIDGPLRPDIKEYSLEEI